ncbi:CRE-DAO-6 protein [Caenorhabditis remanei]|uniref:CRE-DAO-6 protein n=2 Tax=Caenorhabditis TaxID=6237 RepID=E3LS91_CAERE|nr:CRE-DAO-6 protein [Caenorhabditis remanei]
MWKKSLTAYKKVEEEGEKDNTKQHSFNYQKLTDSETMPKQNKNRKSSSYSFGSMTSTSSSSSTCPSSKRYTSTQQSFAFVPPIFPVVPQKFVFFG